MVTILYWVFVVVSTSMGMRLAWKFFDKESFKATKFIYLIPLGISMCMYCFVANDKRISFGLGVLYWIIYVLWFKGYARRIFSPSSDGYQILKKVHKDYNKIVYDLDRECTTCGYACTEVETLKCGHKIHYLFQCEECGAVWTGHFIK